MAKEKRLKFSIYLDSIQWERLKLESGLTGAPIAELVRRALRDRYPVEDEEEKEK